MPRYKTYSKAFLIDKLILASKIFGKNISKLEIDSHPDFPNKGHYQGAFGSWNNAKILAELVTNKEGARVKFGKYIRRKATLKQRFEIFHRDNFTCQYCGRTPTEDGIKLVIDHKTPFSKNGLTEYENLVTACFECNIGKFNHFDTKKSATTIK